MAGKANFCLCQLWLLSDKSHGSSSVAGKISAGSTGKIAARLTNASVVVAQYCNTLTHQQIGHNQIYLVAKHIAIPVIWARAG